MNERELARALRRLSTRWGVIWWWPWGARLYQRLFRWLWTRCRGPLWLYRPMAWLYSHWYDREEGG